MNIKNKRFKEKDFSCHNGPVEVTTHLFCGSETEILETTNITKHFDTLVPLHALDGVIWDSGFRGEILYYPIQDYGILPTDVLEKMVADILDRLANEKNVGLFCMGGHGRTGYVASVVLGKLGCEDPIGFLRSNYCKEAVESNEQVAHIAEVLGKPQIAEMYTVSLMRRYFREEWPRIYDLCECIDEDMANDLFPPLETDDVCGNCRSFDCFFCNKYKVIVDEDEWACGEFDSQHV